MTDEELIDALRVISQRRSEIDALVIARLRGVPDDGRWLSWPVQVHEKVITSPFGVDRGAYVHEGVDLRAPFDSVILAPADGIVERAYVGKSYGNCIITQHEWRGKAYRIYHAHLNRWLVSDGQTIQRGQPIAHSGNTGNSTAPHYHLTLVEVGNTARLKGVLLIGCIDPLPHFIEKGTPK